MIGRCRTISTDLDQVGVPGISGDAEVVVTLLLRGRECHVSLCMGMRRGGGISWTYLLSRLSVNMTYAKGGQYGGRIAQIGIRGGWAYGTWRRAQIVLPCWWGLPGVGTKRIEWLEFKKPVGMPPNGKMTGWKSETGAARAL